MGPFCRGVRLQTLAQFAGRVFLGEGIRPIPALVYISASGRNWFDDGLRTMGSSVDAMEDSSHYLYVALKNDTDGVEIWRREGPSRDFCLIRPELCGIF
jgi:hypothetical protein